MENIIKLYFTMQLITQFSEQSIDSILLKTSVYREKKHPYICFVMTMY